MLILFMFKFLRSNLHLSLGWQSNKYKYLKKYSVIILSNDNRIFF